LTPPDRQLLKPDSIRRANDLRDTRGSLLTELGKLVEFRSLENADGSLTVMVGMRNLVDGTRVNGIDRKSVV